MRIFSFALLSTGFLWLWDITNSWLVVLIAAIVVTGFFIAAGVSKVEKEINKKRQQVTDEIRQGTINRFLDKLQIYSDTLLKKARQTIYKDDYGKRVYDKWFLERDYFIDKVLADEIPGILEVLDRESITSEIDRLIIARLDEPVSQSSTVEDVSPVEFEHHCAELLRASGWDVRVTQASGDQGIDIIAKIGGVSAVFQCKKYARPVGNSAVQEVIAGKVFENADIAAVVSNTSYTSSARQLAAAANVHLLHYQELSQFSEKLGMR